MARNKDRRENLATEIIRKMKASIWKYRIALIISLAGNVVMAAVLIFR